MCRVLLVFSIRLISDAGRVRAPRTTDAHR